MHSKMFHYMRDDLTDFEYDPQTFTDRLYKFDETIKNILEEQDPTKQIVRVQNQADRIVITQKLVSKNLHLKIVDDGEKVFSTEYLEDEALIAYYEVLTKMYEMYLEGLIGNNFKKETDLIAENFIKKQPTAKEECIYELFCKFNQILNSPDSKSKTFKCYPREYELSDEEKNSLKTQGRDLALRKLISGDVPEYFYELVFKVRSKNYMAYF